MSGGLEPPHLPLSLANRFMGYLGAVVRPTPGIVRYCRHDLTMGDAIALELVRDQAIGPLSLSSQQLEEEASSCTAIPARLHQNVDDIAILIDSSPEILLPASDLHEHLVQIPEISESALFPLEPASVFAAELPAPLANRLVGYNDAALGQQVFDVGIWILRTENTPFFFRLSPNLNFF